MNPLQWLFFLLIVVAAPGVVLTRDPRSQVIALSFYGLLFAGLFFAFAAPDVALSQLVIGAVALPLMVLLALAKIRRDRRSKEPGHE